MVRNEVLEFFILGFGLEITDGGNGRPTEIGTLWQAANDKCGECSMDELLDALFNLHTDHAVLYKFVPVDNLRFSRFSFERVRNTHHWQDFFTRGGFRIKVLPGGRLRYQRLMAELESQLSQATPPARPKRIGFTAPE